MTLHPSLDRWLGRVLPAIAIGLILFTAVRLARGFAEESSSGLPVIGDEIALPPALFETSDYTVVAFTQTACPACNRARPMLEALISRVAPLGNVAIKIAIPAAEPSASDDHAVSLGLRRDALVRLTPQQTTIRTVPALVVVDRRGLVLFAREGGLVDGDAEAILRAVGRG